MSAAPPISIVMPVRDGGAWLRAAVESLYAQHCGDFELLLVDDHSLDEAIAGLPRDPRLRVLANRGRGIVAALNTGLAAARGALVARMDGDDIALPERLAVQREFLAANPQIGIAGAQVEIFVEGGEPAGGYRHYQRWINGLCSAPQIAREIFVESPIPHPSAIWRREVVDALGGYRETAWAEDYDLWLRAHRAGVAMGKPQGVLLRWRDHRARLSRCDPRCARERFIEAKAEALAAHIALRRTVALCGTGAVATQLHDALAARGVAPRCFLDINPRRIGGHKRGLPVLALDAAPGLCAEGVLLLGALGRRGAGESLRGELTGLGLRETRDFLLCA